MKGKKAKCDFCGAPFEALKKNAKHCDACRHAIMLADRHAQYRIKFQFTRPQGARRGCKTQA